MNSPVESNLRKLAPRELLEDLSNTHTDIAIGEIALHGALGTYDKEFIAQRLQDNRIIAHIIETEIIRRCEGNNSGQR